MCPRMYSRYLHIFRVMLCVVHCVCVCVYGIEMKAFFSVRAREGICETRDITNWRTNPSSLPIHAGMYGTYLPAYMVDLRCFCFFFFKKKPRLTPSSHPTCACTSLHFSHLSSLPPPSSTQTHPRPCAGGELWARKGGSHLSLSHSLTLLLRFQDGGVGVGGGKKKTAPTFELQHLFLFLF